MTLTRLVPIPNDINRGVTPARQRTMLSLLGNPRENYDDKCRAATDPAIVRLTVSKDVGPFMATGLRPAVESLRAILRTVAEREPDVHAVLGNMGMACARLVRGSATAISNHAWGTAIDLTIEGKLDTRGDDRVQVGLTRIFPYFNAAGWYWGAGFRTEDAMHFEAGDALIRQWHGDGAFAATGTAAPADPALSLGDRGPDVVELQRLLNKATGARLVPDGDFGLSTHAQVIAFQAAQGLYPDGVAGPRTLAALRKAG